MFQGLTSLPSSSLHSSTHFLTRVKNMVCACDLGSVWSTSTKLWLCLNYGSSQDINPTKLIRPFHQHPKKQAPWFHSLTQIFFFLSFMVMLLTGFPKMPHRTPELFSKRSVTSIRKRGIHFNNKYKAKEEKAVSKISSILWMYGDFQRLTDLITCV